MGPRGPPGEVVPGRLVEESKDRVHLGSRCGAEPEVIIRPVRMRYAELQALAHAIRAMLDTADVGAEVVPQLGTQGQWILVEAKNERSAGRARAILTRASTLPLLIAPSAPA